MKHVVRETSNELPYPEKLIPKRFIFGRAKCPRRLAVHFQASWNSAYDLSGLVEMIDMGIPVVQTTSRSTLDDVAGDDGGRPTVHLIQYSESYASPSLTDSDSAVISTVCSR